MTNTKYWCDEAFSKDDLLQEVNSIATNSLNNKKDYEEALYMIVARTCGFENKDIEELKDEFKVLKLKDIVIK